MLIYLFLNVLIIILGLYVSFGRNCLLSKISYIYSFVFLTFIAAIRFEIGVDYNHYEFFYYAIKKGASTYKYSEPVFYWFMRLFCDAGFDFKVFISVASFLTILFFYKSTSKRTFFFEILLFYGLLYLQSYCLIRQMLACSISIYALKKKSDNKWYCVFLLVLAALIHKSFWVIFVIYLVSFKLKICDKFIFSFLILFFVIVFFTPFVDNVLGYVLQFTSSSYFVLMRKLGPVVFLRYIFMFLYLYLILKYANTNLNKLMLISMFMFECLGTRILVFSSRMPQTFYAEDRGH